MSLFKEHLYQMAAYTPPLEGRSVEKHLLLDFNERTLPVSNEVVEALCDYIRSGQLQKYPSYGDIVDELARYVGVQSGQLMITNGSDQGIDLVIRAAVSEGDRAIIPAPSFAMYRQCAEVENAEIIAPEYDRKMGYPTGEVLAEISTNTRLIVVAQPNNPCGTAVSREDLEMLLRAAPDSVVLVDECYYEYSQQTVVDLVDKYANLVVARTFSKTWGLPSLRFGFLVSQANNIAQLLKIRGPYDINQLSIVAVRAALASPDYTREYVREVMEESKPLLESWLDEHKVPYWKSTANYIWAFFDKPEPLAEHLQQQGILVRPKKDPDGKLGLRMTLGNMEQTRRLIASIEDFYQ